MSVGDSIFSASNTILAAGGIDFGLLAAHPHKVRGLSYVLSFYEIKDLDRTYRLKLDNLMVVRQVRFCK